VHTTRHVFFILAFGLLSNCAAPPLPPGAEVGGFVPPEELALVSLARQGMWDFNQGRYIDAELMFRQVLYLRPDLKNIKQNLAATLEKEDLYEEAQALYAELLADDPQSVPKLSGLARLYYAQGDFKKAREQFEQVLVAAADANSVEDMAHAAQSLSVLSFKAGDEESAWCYAGYVQKLKPSNEAFLRDMRMFMALGRYRDMAELAAKYMLDNDLGQDPVFLHQRSLGAFALGNFKDAYTFETRAVELSLGKNVDPAVQFEMRVVSSMARRAAPPPGAGLSPDDQDKQAEGQEDFMESLKAFAQTNQTYTLYWPVNLVEMVQAALEEKL
jgi:tetratricopeptide (TPR) repeat protein